MRKPIIALLSAGGVLFAGEALAVCSNPGGAVGGAAAGAAAGAAIGGPPGAAVGGIVGGAAGGHALPPTVCSYVVEEEVPPVYIEEEVVVGEPLPETVEVYPIPETRTYVFADVNDERVLVDPETRVVVEVVD